MLELKESNSPFWLMGLSNGRYVAGSSGNVPCYYKSKGKQFELAQNMLKNKGIDEVYLLTGIEWDNMPMTDNKTIVGYIKNKGNLIAKKSDLDTDKGLELKENDKNELPKKVKLYSNSGMALEDKEVPELKNIKENADDDLIKRFNDTLENGHSDDFFKNYTKDELEEFDKYLLDLNQPQLVKDIVHWQIRNAIDQYDKLNREKEINESYNKNEFSSTGYNTAKYDIYKLKNNDTYFVMKKGEVPWENKELMQTDKDGAKNVNKLHLKESKIVTPVGNPQTAGSFVNIDVDLDHMEVSDFLVRLSQAIRSEQGAILEYTALISANGITNEERENVRRIMEEEKNHMCALSAMLYKQVLLNHQQNMNEAGKEFVLPTFGAQDLEENKELKESINSMVNYFLADSINSEIKEINESNNKKYIFKLNESIDIEASSTMSQDQYNIIVDINYDEDFIGNIAENIKNAINIFNETHGKNGFGFAEDKYSVGNGKLEVMLITLDGIYNDEITNDKIKGYVNELINLADTPEYFIEAKF